MVYEMRISVIGWYGTETIGDRAILAGLLSFFNKSFEYFELSLGSLNPFFSERTIAEDATYYEEITGKSVNIKIFNTKSSKQLLFAINCSDLVIMGGGPLMDLDELFMVEYAFRKAKKKGIKTIVMGCGIGPLFSKESRKAVVNIFNNSDVSILRDNNSKKFLTSIFKEFKQSINTDLIKVSLDPAVECALKFNQIENDSNGTNVNTSSKYIAVNLREFPLEYSKESDSKSINDEIFAFVDYLSAQFPDKTLKLIPMHYFHIGGDDRVFLNKIAFNLNRKNIEVQNTPLTLKETMNVFKNADFNIGMRFHSVVLQTFLSGKNYVLDYTEPKKGKTNGFLMDIDNSIFYKNRYTSLQEDKIPAQFVKSDEISNKLEFDKDYVQSSLDVYVEQLKKTHLSG